MGEPQTEARKSRVTASQWATALILSASFTANISKVFKTYKFLQVMPLAAGYSCSISISKTVSILASKHSGRLGESPYDGAGFKGMEAVDTVLPSLF